MDMRVERDVAAPATTVWDVVTDLEHAPQVLSGVDAIERLDGAAGFGVGTRWRETRTLFGRTASEELEITSVEPGRAYSVGSQSGGVTYRSTLSVTAVDATSSHLTMTFTGTTEGLGRRLLAATVGRAFQAATRKTLQQDLDDIAAAAERRRRGSAD